MKKMEGCQVAPNHTICFFPMALDAFNADVVARVLQEVDEADLAGLMCLSRAWLCAVLAHGKRVTYYFCTKFPLVRLNARNVFWKPRRIIEAFWLARIPALSILHVYCRDVDMGKLLDVNVRTLHLHFKHTDLGQAKAHANVTKLHLHGNTFTGIARLLQTTQAVQVFLTDGEMMMSALSQLRWDKWSPTIKSIHLENPIGSRHAQTFLGIPLDIYFIV